MQSIFLHLEVNKLESIAHNIDLLANLSERYLLPTALKQEPNQLSASQYNILHFIYTHHRVRPRDLADALEISSPAVTYALQRLETNKLIKIVASQEDRREKSAALTKKGASAVEAITKSRDELISRILNSLSNTEKDHLAKGLEAFLIAASKDIGQDKLCLKCGFAHSDNCVLNRVRGQTKLEEE